MDSQKLVVDAMLGSLARKLRVFGFDTVYFREGSDPELLELAREEGRILLTSDRALVDLATRRGVRALLVHGRTEPERVRSLDGEARRASIKLNPGASRCAICNTVLVRVGRSEVRWEVPEAVASHHRLYYRCERCDRLYWKGSHWRRLKSLSSILGGR